MTRYLALLLAALCIAPALADDNTGSVEGTLLDEVTGKPAAHVAVVLDGDHALLQSSTDTRGHFVFLTVLPGRYTVEGGGGRVVGQRSAGIPAMCGPQAQIDVNAGLTWHLPPLSYGPLWDVFCPTMRNQPLQQLTTAGTTASLYVINE